MNINKLAELIEKQKKIVDEIQSIESFIKLYRDDESRNKYIMAKEERRKALLTENAKLSFMIETADFKLSDNLVTLLNNRTKYMGKLKNLNDKMMYKKDDENIDVYLAEYKECIKMYHEVEQNIKMEFETFDEEKISQIELDKIRNSNASDISDYLEYAKDVVDLHSIQESIDTNNSYIMALANDDSIKARTQEKNRVKQLEQLYLRKKEIEGNTQKYSNIKFGRDIALKILQKQEIENKIFELDNSIGSLKQNELDNLIIQKKELLNGLKECNSVINNYFFNKNQRKQDIIVEMKRLNLNSERNVENLNLMKLESLNNKHKNSIDVGIEQIANALNSNKQQLKKLIDEFISIGGVLKSECDLLQSELKKSIDFANEINKSKKVINNKKEVELANKEDIEKENKKQINNKNVVKQENKEQIDNKHAIKQEPKKQENTQSLNNDEKKKIDLKELFKDYTMNGDVLDNIERYGTSYISKIKCDPSLNKPVQEEPTVSLKQKIELFKKKREYKKLLTEAKLMQHNQSEYYGMLNRNIEYLEHEITQQENQKHR